MSWRDVRVSRRARREILTALEWWWQNRPDAPDLLEREIDRAIEIIATQPRIGTIVRSRRLDEVRRYSIGRTRYSLYYSLVGGRPFFLSLWHDSRGARPSV